MSASRTLSDTERQRLVLRLATGRKQQQRQAVQQLFDGLSLAGPDGFDELLSTVCECVLRADGSIGALVNLFSDDADVHAPSIGLLINLCQSPAFRDRVHSQHGSVVPTLLAMLDSPHRDSALVALANLTVTVQLARSAADHGAIEKLVPMLRSLPSAAILWHATRVFHFLVQDSHNRSRKAAAAGAVSALARAVPRLSGDYKAGHALCSLWQIVTAVTPSKLPERQLKLALDSALQIAAAPEAPDASDAAVEVRTKAFGVLQALLEAGPSMCVHMRDAQVLPLAASQLSHPDEERQSAALGVVMALIQYTPNQQVAAVAEAGGLDAVLRWLLMNPQQVTPEQETDRRRAAILLCKFATASQAAAKTAADAGAIPAYIRAAAAEQRVTTRGALLRGLCNLIPPPYNTAHAAQAVDAGLLQLGLETLREPQHRQQTYAAAALNIAVCTLQEQQAQALLLPVVQQLCLLLRTADTSTGLARVCLQLLYNAALRSSRLSGVIDTAAASGMLQRWLAAPGAGQQQAEAAEAQAQQQQEQAVLTSAARDTALLLMGVLAARKGPAAELEGLQTIAITAPAMDWDDSKLAEMKASFEVSMKEHAAVAEASLAACAGCGATERQGGGKLLPCSSCKQAAYCSRACQKEHWKVHRKGCHFNGSAQRAP